ncbi:MAG: TrmH family RNA methyltransferase [Acidimicrobiales bacterium]
MQRLRRLLRQRSARRADGVFVAEGVRVLDAAVAANAPIEAVYYGPEALVAPVAVALLERARQAGLRVLALQAGVIERVSGTVTPQPVLGVVGRVDVELESLLSPDPVRGVPALVVVCVDVRDPGNLGSVLRSADASGAAGVVCCDGSADVYNPKTVRASAGSVFHVPIVVERVPAEVLAALGAAGFERVGTMPRGGTDYAVAALAGRVALVLGNEASGLDAEAASYLDTSVSIPMLGRAESLNVAMAATVLCFELARRRRASDGDAGDPAGIARLR